MAVPTSSPHNAPEFRPVPDPTVLTTQQLAVAILNLKELFESRMSGMDKAVELLQQTANRSPTVNEVYMQHEERFKSIAVQFAERDIRTEQTSRDSKVAVDAALQAAKEAVGEQNKSSALAIAKSEAATTKQMDQIAVIIQTTNSGVNDKIDDIKDRITSIESKKTGSSEMLAFVFGGIGVIVGVVGVVLALRH